MSQVHDRRVARTQRSLQQALFGLIQTKRYDKVTVQDIIDRADVGRSTFYAHYDTKDDLLLSSMERLTADIDRFLEDESGLEGPVLPVRGLFHHVAEHHPVFGALFGTSGIDLVTRAAREMLADRALQTIREREAAGIHHPVSADMRAAFLAGSLMTFVSWWLDAGLPMGPDAATDAFDSLVAAA
ncbi:TetR/AcrR family transcriptional regulator [Demequina sp. TTPB684]|uniref:TetR/AcrR family transcriptional regulator n=1 Tax=unclassified Demequina TaxID=2620311 RepID=UPI001CF458BF|nr:MULTISPECIES: TetR/AcrR family transcriptional regulator [unclassified Demequina]MCB2412318.1 TetR/AcrR family transcriptional regulator [Demequina sp. TTPB684]UPU89487.1 TetR/AcrR family transcriptional regulator [Demequina sp. TMPB413]